MLNSSNFSKNKKQQTYQLFFPINENLILKLSFEDNYLYCKDIIKNKQMITENLSKYCLELSPDIKCH